MFKNLTPHVVNIFDAQGGLLTSLPPEEPLLRCEELKSLHSVREGVPVFKVSYGMLRNLPDIVPGVYLIASLLVLQAATDMGRTDVYSPGVAVRDENKNIIGCIGLSTLS